MITSFGEIHAAKGSMDVCTPGNHKYSLLISHLKYIHAVKGSMDVCTPGNHNY